MRIRHLWIDNFRGIESLDWAIPNDQRLIALIGPGDTGKSTILEAIYLLLSDRWIIPFNDVDFHGIDLNSPIRIRALLTQLPPGLMKDTTLGLWLSGADQAGGPTQDPEDGTEPALLVELQVDSALEPIWAVIRLDGQRQPLSAAMRRQFSTFRVDDRADVQLRWSRTSALGRLSSASGADREALAHASRAAQDALANRENAPLAQLVTEVQHRSNAIGASHFQGLRAGLDTSRSAMGASLALYEGAVPLTSYGLGTRRLTSLAAQQLAASDRAIALVDELESGLEPHRAVRLLEFLKEDRGYAQVFVTTHSPVVVEQAQLSNLATVQNQDGRCVVTHLGGAFGVAQRIQRARPSSLLARRVIVVEGKTEHGLILECLQTWDDDNALLGLPTSAGKGAAIQDAGGGSEVAPRVQTLIQLGYSAAGLLDNDDKSVERAVTRAVNSGALIVRWQAGHCTEQEVCSGLEAEDLTEFLHLGVELRGSESTVIHELNQSGSYNDAFTLDVRSWIGSDLTIEDARRWVAATAIDGKWFKTVDSARELAKWILKKRGQPSLSTTMERLDQIRRFVYETPEAEASRDDSDA